METDNNAMREALSAIDCVDTRGLKRLLYELVEADIFDGGLINRTISAVDRAKAALDRPPRNCDAGKDGKTLLDDYISKNGITSDSQVRALYDLALPVIEWILSPAE